MSNTHMSDANLSRTMFWDAASSRAAMKWRRLALASGALCVPCKSARATFPMSFPCILFDGRSGTLAFGICGKCRTALLAAKNERAATFVALNRNLRDGSFEVQPPKKRSERDARARRRHVGLSAPERT